jgi:hypothetical protein
MANDKRSNKKDAARRRRSKRGWSLRSNRSAQDTLAESAAAAEAEDSAVGAAGAVPSIDLPASPALIERVPPVMRWGLMITLAAVVGVMVGLNYTVQLGLTAGVAMLLAGGAFLAAYVPPTLRDRPGDDTAVGFGRSTGHDRPDATAIDDQPHANRAARRRAKKEGAE